MRPPLGLALEERPSGFLDVRTQHFGALCLQRFHEREVIGRHSLQRPAGRQLEHEQPQLRARLLVGLGKARPKKDVGKKDVEGVFVVGTDNKVTFRPVKVGIAGEKHFEVLTGLKEGDKIVAGTYQAIRELKDNALVKETKTDAKKPGSKT